MALFTGLYYLVLKYTEYDQPPGGKDCIQRRKINNISLSKGISKHVVASCELWVYTNRRGMFL